MPTPKNSKLVPNQNRRIGKRSVVFEYWQSENKQWYWHLKSGNGEIIAQSEGYLRSSSCMRIFTLLSTTTFSGPKRLFIAPEYRRSFGA